MRCYNTLCFYWQKGCILEAVYLDQQGRCAYCVPVRLSPRALRAAKARMAHPFARTGPLRFALSRRTIGANERRERHGTGDHREHPDP